jgi:heptosyltransferase-3
MLYASIVKCVVSDIFMRHWLGRLLRVLHYHRYGEGPIDASAQFKLPDRARILVIVMRRLGDVFLTTPLLRTLRKSFPDATIEVLVFHGTEGILSGNPDINAVTTVLQRPSARELFALIRHLWRRYDLAVSTQTGDRPTFLAYVAGRRRIGLAPTDGSGVWWKRRVLNLPVTANVDNHRVVELLRLADGLGIISHPELVCAANASAAWIVPNASGGRYAVLHPKPMYRFRRWTDDGWRSLANSLTERGLSVVVTGGPDASERAYLDALWRPTNSSVYRVDGRLDWPELAALIGGAAVYVGPDTSMTHLAAGTGCPTVALYGPTSPHRIGPWPVGGLEEPWSPARRIQHRGNVWVVQNLLPCLPCEKLGCERHYNSYSRCLDELSVDQVLSAVDQALATPKVQAYSEARF